jgi:hypothetical protein
LEVLAENDRVEAAIGGKLSQNMLKSNSRKEKRKRGG